MDQILTPCLPGKGLVPWVAPMTHPAKTAHPGHMVLSKKRLTGLMGASRCRLGGQSASRKKSQRDNTGHEGGRGGGVWVLQPFKITIPFDLQPTFIVQESPFCFSLPLSIKQVHYLKNGATQL